MENMQKTIKDLNYKLIELNQNIISKESIYQFNKKINDFTKNEKVPLEYVGGGEDRQISVENEKYEIELKRLTTIIDELEIKNNKLIFDKKSLNNKISTIIHDNNIEMNNYKTLHQIQINNLNKVIFNLNKRISKLFLEKNNINNNNIFNNDIDNNIYRNNNNNNVKDTQEEIVKNININIK